jgi:hypothetical protein
MSCQGCFEGEEATNVEFAFWCGGHVLTCGFFGRPDC